MQAYQFRGALDQFLGEQLPVRAARHHDELPVAPFDTAQADYACAKNSATDRFGLRKSCRHGHATRQYAVQPFLWNAPDAGSGPDGDLGEFKSMRRFQFFQFENDIGGLERKSDG